MINSVEQEKNIDIQESTNLKFKFEGNGTEYAKLFFVNLVLNILTIGIYSPWAKVRTLKYFYSNTYLGNYKFDYDGNPIVILISRIIIVVLLILAIFTDYKYDIKVFDLGLGAIFLLILLPILIVRGKSYNFRHTIFRNIRFNYELKYGGFYLVCVILSILIYPIIKFGTFVYNDIKNNLFAFAIFFGILIMFLFPLIFYFKNYTVISQINFGTNKINFIANYNDYYRSDNYEWIVTMLLYFVGSTLLYRESENSYIILYSIVSMILFLCAIISFVYCYIKKLFWTSISFSKENQICNDIKSGKFVVDELGNIFLLIITFGIAYPWIKVNRWRYLTNRVYIKSVERTINIFNSEKLFNIEYQNELI